MRTYRVIYQLTEDIEKALVGLLAPDTVEDVLGEAEVRALFRSSRLGVIAGCMVTTGKFERSARVRVVREGALVWDGNIGSLRRVQEDVREVAAGLRVRHPARGLQRPQGGRRPRVLRHPPGRAQLAGERRRSLHLEQLRRAIVRRCGRASRRRRCRRSPRRRAGGARARRAPPCAARRFRDRG